MERPQELAEKISSTSGKITTIGKDAVLMEIKGRDGKNEYDLLFFGFDERRKRFFAAVVSDEGHCTSKREAEISEVLALKNRARLETPGFDHLWILEIYSSLLQEADSYLGC